MSQFRPESRSLPKPVCFKDCDDYCHGENFTRPVCGSCRAGFDGVDELRVAVASNARGGTDCRPDSALRDRGPAGVGRTVSEVSRPGQAVGFIARGFAGGAAEGGRHRAGAGPRSARAKPADPRDPTRRCGIENAAPSERGEALGSADRGFHPVDQAGCGLSRHEADDSRAKSRSESLGVSISGCRCGSGRQEHGVAPIGFGPVRSCAAGECRAQSDVGGRQTNAASTGHV